MNDQSMTAEPITTDWLRSLPGAEAVRGGYTALRMTPYFADGSWYLVVSRKIPRQTFRHVYLHEGDPRGASRFLFIGVVVDRDNLVALYELLAQSNWPPDRGPEDATAQAVGQAVH